GAGGGGLGLGRLSLLRLGVRLLRWLRLGGVALLRIRGGLVAVSLLRVAVRLLRLGRGCLLRIAVRRLGLGLLRLRLRLRLGGVGLLRVAVRRGLPLRRDVLRARLLFRLLPRRLLLPRRRRLWLRALLWGTLLGRAAPQVAQHVALPVVPARHVALLSCTPPPCRPARNDGAAASGLRSLRTC
ncbi:hypothetical protein, partial [Streptomyces sp. AC555_RSS877]|uniref:hypothetical protein n=1 Tax=Streptomyces sp. AC555_RSS877 TaxID=2823688 RepID=UPI001C25974C